MSEKNKQIFLFCSHETDRLARSVQDNIGILPNSNISENVFDVCAEEMVDSKNGIEEWIKQIGS